MKQEEKREEKKEKIDRVKEEKQIKLYLNSEIMPLEIITPKDDTEEWKNELLFGVVEWGERTMNREIKFRAWNWKKKIMITQNDRERIDKCLTYYETNPKVILEQYTGKNDKNRNEVYENDIVMGDGWIGIVEVIDYTWQVRRINAEGEVGEWFRIDQYEFERIGNIHENPELLGVKNNE